MLPKPCCVLSAPVQWLCWARSEQPALLLAADITGQLVLCTRPREDAVFQCFARIDTDDAIRAIDWLPPTGWMPQAPWAVRNASTHCGRLPFGVEGFLTIGACGGITLHWRLVSTDVADHSAATWSALQGDLCSTSGTEAGTGCAVWCASLFAPATCGVLLAWTGAVDASQVRLHTIDLPSTQAKLGKQRSLRAVPHSCVVVGSAVRAVRALPPATPQPRRLGGGAAQMSRSDLEGRAALLVLTRSSPGTIEGVAEEAAEGRLQVWLSPSMGTAGAPATPSAVPPPLGETKGALTIPPSSTGVRSGHGTDACLALGTWRLAWRSEGFIALGVGADIRCEGGISPGGSELLTVSQDGRMWEPKRDTNPYRTSSPPWCWPNWILAMSQPRVRRIRASFPCSHLSQPLSPTLPHPARWPPPLMLPSDAPF